MANKDLSEFNLDDILSEFHTDAPAEKPDIKMPSLEKAEDELDLSSLDSLLFGTPETEASTPEIGEIPVLSDVPESPAQPVPQTQPEAASEETPQSKSSAPDDLDALLGEFTESEAAADAVSSDDTIRFTPAEPVPAPETTDDTIRMDTVGTDTSSAAPATASILYNPRTRLRELKKKLVAGPEKRYYELSELGVGKLQVAILVNVIVVILCAVLTTLFTMGHISESRLRFVVFTQVLAMLVSALMGSSEMIDGLGDLFRGRISIRALLAITFAVCCVDSVLCLIELRVPCCAAFSLEMTMALWGQYHRRSTEMAEMDTMRKAVRLNSIVKKDNYYNGLPGILRGLGEVEDFMDNYQKPATPETLQGIAGLVSLLLCFGISAFAGISHGASLAIQILATSLLVAVPASAFIAVSRPMAILEKRLHMVGTVLCGWKGVRALSKKAAFPILDNDLFPTGSSKLNGVKFYGKRNPDDAVSYAATLVYATGGGLVPIFQNLCKSRNCPDYPVLNFRNYGDGGIGGEVRDEPVLLGNLNFLQSMGVEIPQGITVNQAVYVAIDGQLCAVFAISYAKMRSSSAGLVSLCGNRKLTPVIVSGDFTLTEELLQERFGINTRRVAFPEPEVRQVLSAHKATSEEDALALATREDLVSITYAVSGARALRTATNLGVGLNLFGGILGMVIMLVLAYLGSAELLTPTNVLLYQLVWLVPTLLITEWTRTV